jgi:hypothetical protein
VTLIEDDRSGAALAITPPAPTASILGWRLRA